MVNKIILENIDKDFISDELKEQINNNFSENIINNINNIENKINENNKPINETNILNSDYYNDNNNIADLRKIGKTFTNLNEVFKYFSIKKPYLSRYESPSMPSYTIHELQKARKYNLLQHKKNNSINISRGEKLARIYKNKNLRHSSYATQSFGNITSPNINNYEFINTNSIRYSGQVLNPKLVISKLTSNNGGNHRIQNNESNYLLNINTQIPLTGIRRKSTYNEISKHKFNNGRMRIF